MGDFGDDSEESDAEGGLGNVNRLIMRPPGHSGKAKKGHLCFDASYETGNLGRVDLINEFEYDLFIRPDTCNPRYRFWFNFTVDNRVIFNIVNMSNSRNLFSDNFVPVVKSSSRPKWQKIPKRNVFYERSVQHQGRHVLSFTFGFDKEDELFQFALTYPYSYSRLQSYLELLETEAQSLNNLFSRELLGKSVQKRRLDLITIGSKGDMESRQKQRVVAIMARVHPGDAPASFVCQGILELLISSHPIACILREHVMFKIVPMLNPDGVFLGNYRSSVMGFNLNRSWHIASSFVHPTIKAALEMLDTLDKSSDFQLDFVVDLHTNSNLKGCFIYGNTYDDVYRYERHVVLPKLLATVAEDYNPSNTMFNSDTNKFGTARRYLCSFLSENVNCYTFEVSIFGYNRKGHNEATIPYTESGYMRCGRNLIKTFLEYYQVTGAIPFRFTCELSSKKRRPKTHRSPYKNKRHSSQERPKTVRQPAALHLMDLNAYDTETSADELYSYHLQRPAIKSEPNLPSKDQTNNVASKADSDSPPPPTILVLPEPSLSIIDFNLITRNGIDEATKQCKMIKKRL